MTTNNITELTIDQPDDWHLHLRDEAALSRTVPDTARYFSRAIVMPNLMQPVTTTEMARNYYERIIAARPQGNQFKPLMTLYLTDNTSASEIEKAAASGIVQGVKFYPAGGTTNSDAGVTDLKHCANALAAMQDIGMPLLMHGEVTDADIDVFDREKVFIANVLKPLLNRFPKLRAVLEHITTKDAVNFVQSADERVAATITAHHLLLNRNDLLVGGIHPHNYCLPILKRNTHQLALIEAATSGNPKFFLGTDSAPHLRHAKESSCGCAGIYSAHAAIELYAEAFEAANSLDKLEGFASHFGPDFYKLSRNKQGITLKRKAWQVPEHYSLANEILVPMRASENIQWQVIPLN